VGQQSLCGFRNWLFNLLIDFLVNSGWVIVIKNFEKSEKETERNYLGLTDYKNETIFLDRKGGTPRILIHELCHFALGVSVLEEMAKNLPFKEIRKIKGKKRTNKEFEWVELKTQEFERLFYYSLTKKQVKTLRGFIDEAMVRYKQDGE